MGTTGTIFTSVNGSTWNKLDISAHFSDCSNIGSVVWDGTQWIAFCVASGNTVIFRSSDMITINRVDPANVGEVEFSAAGNGVIVAAGFFDFLVSSDAGVTWNTHSYSSSYILPPLAFGNGIFVAAQTASHNSGPSVVMQTSADGVSWANSATITNVGSIFNLVFANGLFYLIGIDNGDLTALWTSNNGTAWSKVSLPALTSANNYTGFAFGNGSYIITPEGAGQNCFVSTDGLAFSSAATMPSIGAWKKLTFSNGLFVAMNEGGNGALATTTDGTAWTLIEPVEGTGVNFNNITSHS